MPEPMRRELDLGGRLDLIHHLLEAVVGERPLAAQGGEEIVALLTKPLPVVQVLLEEQVKRPADRHDPIFGSLSAMDVDQSVEHVHMVEFQAQRLTCPESGIDHDGEHRSVPEPLEAVFGRAVEHVLQDHHGILLSDAFRQLLFEFRLFDRGNGVDGQVVLPHGPFQEGFQRLVVVQEGVCRPVAFQAPIVKVLPQPFGGDVVQVLEPPIVKGEELPQNILVPLDGGRTKIPDKQRRLAELLMQGGYFISHNSQGL